MTHPWALTKENLDMLMQRGLVRLQNPELNFRPRKRPEDLVQNANAADQRRWRAKNRDVARLRTRRGMRALRERMRNGALGKG